MIKDNKADVIKILAGGTSVPLVEVLCHEMPPKTGTWAGDLGFLGGYDKEQDYLWIKIVSVLLINNPEHEMPYERAHVKTPWGNRSLIPRITKVINGMLSRNNISARVGEDRIALAFGWAA